MYTVDYFIKKFEAIPEEKWMTGSLVSPDGTMSCALGHCGVREYQMTEESVDLENLLVVAFPEIAEELKITAPGEFVYCVNDDGVNLFRQKSPRQRMLAALRLAKIRLNQGIEPSTERRNEVQSELPYVDQTKTFTNLIPVPEETSDLIPCEQL